MQQWMEWIRKQRQYATDQNGGVMILFAVVLSFIVMVLGLSMDGLRAVNAGTMTANALDAAALAAAKGMREDNLSDDKVVEMAQTYFNANVSTARGISFSPVAVTFDRALGKVDVRATATVETTFGRIFDVAHLDVTRKSQAIYKLNEIELALMLDVTGSMRGQKLRDLEDAAKDLVGILLPDQKTGAPARIALAPYAASVNAGAYAAAVSDGASKDGCVFEREGDDADTDTAPGLGSFLGSEPEPGDPSNRKYSCPNAVIEPLTDDRARLEDAIESYSAKGWTAGHLGAAWAWYLISPDWASVWPADSRPNEYGKKDLIKAVVLMTDGEFNTSYLNGAPNKTSFAQARALCDAMKADDVNVWIFTVGFDLDDAEAIDVLRDCATDEDSFYQPEDGDELRSDFRGIARKLISLRISQ